VTFTVAVDNSGDAPVTLLFPSAQVFDIAVLAEQREVWSRLLLVVRPFCPPGYVSLERHVHNYPSSARRDSVE